MCSGPDRLYIMPASRRRYDLLRKRLDLFTKMLPAVEQGDVRALHRARVATRRLRELLPLLNLDETTARRLTRRLKKATVRLGDIRELDVLASLIDELMTSGSRDRAAFEYVAAAVRDRRDAARAAFADENAVDDLRRLADKLKTALDSLEERDVPRHGGHSAAPERGWRWAVDARIARRAERLQHAIREAGTVYVAERLHDVRIALKKLRYALELDAEIRGISGTPELRTLRRSQELLGRLHDFQMLIAEARRVRDGEPDGTPPLPRDINSLSALIESLEIDCRHLHARYIRERPSLTAICDRLSSRRTPVRVRAGAGRRLKAG